LPPGAFIGLGLIVALKNVIDVRLTKRQTSVVEPVAETASSH
ncbi:MAG TPA: electron transport complex subunit RsxE, partial [Methylophaga sp.]|nr:electron transport complex subunit RsxE [Methylophaga sp.]